MRFMDHCKGPYPSYPSSQSYSRAYAAVVRVWSDTRELRGIYFWNWFGFGGPEDSNYTPRGKPAEAVVRDWYGPRK